MRLKFLDGTEIEGEAGLSSGFLWLTVRGLTLQEAAAIAFNPAKTGRITFEYGDMKDVYIGFTVCTSLMIDTDGVVSICLVKGVS